MSTPTFKGAFINVVVKYIFAAMEVGKDQGPRLKCLYHLWDLYGFEKSVKSELISSKDFFI